MTIELIKGIAMSLVAETTSNSMRENAPYDMEYIRGIMDLVQTLEEMPEER